MTDTYHEAVLAEQLAQSESAGSTNADGRKVHPLMVPHHKVTSVILRCKVDKYKDGVAASEKKGPKTCHQKNENEHLFHPLISLLLHFFVQIGVTKSEYGHNVLVWLQISR